MHFLFYDGICIMWGDINFFNKFYKKLNIVNVDRIMDKL